MDDTKNNITAESIMKNARENIKKRKEQAEMTIEPRSKKDEIKEKLQALNNSWDVANYSYTITSHRKVIGPVLVAGRKTIHGEVSRYIDPAIQKQKEFNEKVASALIDMYDHLNQSVDGTKADLNERLAVEISQLKNELISRYNERLATMEREFKVEIEDNIEKQVRESLIAIDGDIKSRAMLARALEKRAGEGSITTANDDDTIGNVNYLAFENKFRGSMEDIKLRQSSFIRYFNGLDKVLDIGCGRGEFLELMKENGIGAFGVDLDDDMVEYCASRGLNVKRSDALSFLESLEDGSLDGIFIDQVVEHLEPGYLIRLITFCHKKLKEGCYIVVETVNPLSLVSFANFYIDMSHIRPVHPGTLEFLIEFVGFHETKVNFISPIPDYYRLKKVDEALFSGSEKALAEAYNYNIDKLNDILYGAQDYYVVAKK